MVVLELVSQRVLRTRLMMILFYFLVINEKNLPNKLLLLSFFNIIICTMEERKHDVEFIYSLKNKKFQINKLNILHLRLISILIAPILAIIFHNLHSICHHTRLRVRSFNLKSAAMANYYPGQKIWPKLRKTALYLI